MSAELFQSDEFVSRSGVNSRISSFNSDLDSMSSELTTMDGKIATMNSKITTINSNISTINSRITTINSNITNLESRINATLGGTSLYNNSSGTSGTVTLSKNVSNFVFVDIYYANHTDGTFHIIRTRPGYRSDNILNHLRYSNSDGYMVFDSKQIRISGTSITTSKVGYGNFNNDNYTNVRSENNLWIFRVIGYKTSI